MLQHFQSAKTTIFRLEQLQAYKVDSDDDESELQEWLDFVESRVQDGILWKRVRIVQEPRTEYVNNELDFFKRTKRVGAQILVLPMGDFAKLDLDINDFWLIDDSKVLDMKYDSDGSFLGFDVFKDTNRASIRDVLLSNAIDLEEYLSLN